MKGNKTRPRHMRDVIEMGDESQTHGSQRVHKMRDICTDRTMSTSHPSTWSASHEHRDESSERALRISTPTPEYDNIDQTGKKKSRGSTKQWKRWGINRNIIEWTDLNQPTGENASKLNNHLGIYARNFQMFPLTWISWTSMSETTLEEVWADVKIVSVRSAANREALSCHPITGRISFATIKEMRRKSEESIDPISLWRVTRSRNGKFSEEDGAAGKESIQRRLEALTKEEQADPEIREKIFRSEMVLVAMDWF